MIRCMLLATACTLVAALPDPAAAQQRVERFDRGTAVQETVVRSGFSPLRIAKWGSLLTAAGAAAYGFTHHRDADRSYDRLERACEADRDRCEERRPDGAYADPELEALYKSVVNKDHRARVALVASQVAVAATVVFFILDLRPDGTPPNIPYEPRGFSLAPAPDGSLALSVRVPAGDAPPKPQPQP